MTRPGTDSPAAACVPSISLFRPHLPASPREGNRCPAPLLNRSSGKKDRVGVFLSPSIPHPPLFVSLPAAASACTRSSVARQPASSAPRHRVARADSGAKAASRRTWEAAVSCHSWAAERSRSKPTDAARSAHVAGRSSRRAATASIRVSTGLSGHSSKSSAKRLRRAVAAGRSRVASEGAGSSMSVMVGKGGRAESMPAAVAPFPLSLFLPPVAGVAGAATPGATLPAPCSRA